MVRAIDLKSGSPEFKSPLLPQDGVMFGGPEFSSSTLYVNNLSASHQLGFVSLYTGQDVNYWQTTIYVYPIKVIFYTLRVSPFSTAALIEFTFLSHLHRQKQRIFCIPLCNHISHQRRDLPKLSAAPTAAGTVTPASDSTVTTDVVPGKTPRHNCIIPRH